LLPPPPPTPTLLLLLLLLLLVVVVLAPLMLLRSPAVTCPAGIPRRTPSDSPRRAPSRFDASSLTLRMPTRITQVSINFTRKGLAAAKLRPEERSIAMRPCTRAARCKARAPAALPARLRSDALGILRIAKGLAARAVVALAADIYDSWGREIKACSD